MSATFSESQSRILKYLIETCGARRREDGHGEADIRKFLGMEADHFDNAVAPLVDTEMVWSVDPEPGAAFGRLCITATGRVAYNQLFPTQEKQYKGSVVKPLLVMALSITGVLAGAFFAFGTESGPMVSVEEPSRKIGKGTRKKPKSTAGRNAPKAKSANKYPDGKINQAVIAQIKKNSPFTCPKVTEPVTVDGDLSEWKTFPFVVKKPAQIFDGVDSHKGAKDCYFSFAVAYDENNLYIALKVFDDYFWRKKGRAVWSQDGVEIRVQASPEPVRSASKGQNEFKDVFIASVSPSDEEFDQLIYGEKRLPEGAKIVSVRTSKGHDTEVAIPRAWLDKQQGKAWEEFRMNICVDDFDAPKNGRQLWWHPDWRKKYRIDGSGTFQRDK